MFLFVGFFLSVVQSGVMKISDEDINHGHFLLAL